jgi:6-phosphogluconolactonase
VNERQKILVEADNEAALVTSADLVASIACEAVSQRGQCTMALSGGTTPQPLYDLLTRQPRSDGIPWQDVHIFFGDERDVPADHPDSNFRMAQQTLLDRVPVRLEHVHPMPADAADLEMAAGQYAELIIDQVGAGSSGLPAFDLVLLGMGGDGHVASLFPGTPALEETRKLVTVHFVPVLGRRRMTFTLPLINAARNILFLVTGVDKADPVEKVLGDDRAAAAELPAGRVHPTDGTLIFVMDRGAARKTKYKA